MNDRNFEDPERTIEELKSFFFNILYLWIATYIFSFGPKFS